jgi:hypothetical protein
MGDKYPARVPDPSSLSDHRCSLLVRSTFRVVESGFLWVTFDSDRLDSLADQINSTGDKSLLFRSISSRVVSARWTVNPDNFRYA